MELRKMKPIDFKYANLTLQPSGKTYSEHVTGVDPLPIFTNGEQCVSCWQMSWRERLSALFIGRVWLAVLSGGSQPPVRLVAEKSYLMES